MPLFRNVVLFGPRPFDQSLRRFAFSIVRAPPHGGAVDTGRPLDEVCSVKCFRPWQGGPPRVINGVTGPL